MGVCDQASAAATCVHLRLFLRKLNCAWLVEELALNTLSVHFPYMKVSHI